MRKTYPSFHENRKCIFSMLSCASIVIFYENIRDLNLNFSINMGMKKNKKTVIIKGTKYEE